MSTVFLAVHQDVPNLRVVIKLLSDPQMVERFRAEADKLALLDGNPHICQIKHFFNHGDDFAIAMEYIEGFALDEYVKKQGKMSVADAVRLTADVLKTLQFAHEHGISHRDIKPSNLMLDKQQRIKIIDFGIAKSETDPNLTVAGSSCGTPAYMAPEQFNPTEGTNYVLADIYAVGTTLYYLITGQLPFKGDNAFALRDAKLFTEPSKPRNINKEIPQELENIILKALAKNPEDRYSSAAEMQQALSGMGIDSKTEALKIPAELTRVEAASSRKTGFNPLFIAIPGIIVAMVAAYLIFFPKGIQAPEIPIPAEPGNGAQLESSTPILRWSISVGEGGLYELVYADNPNFSDPRTIGGLTKAEYSMKKSLEPGQYFWKVRSVNKDRQRSEFSSAFSFTVPIIEAAIPQGELLISISPNGDLYLNNELKTRGENEMSFNLDTGQYFIRVENSKSRQKAFADTVKILAGEATSRNYRFTFPEKKPKPPQEEYGYIRIGSMPKLGAEISIDGERQSNVTPYRFKLKAGRHIIMAVLEVDGRILTRTDTITVTSGSDDKYLFDFEK